ncbi:MAG: hypothetical protein PUE18_04625 [Firmicutes bacterium]|nr:hypothetical protein [Bacillota bacterium]
MIDLLNTPDDLDNELNEEETQNLIERMCDSLKPRKLSKEEIEQLKREGRL